MTYTTDDARNLVVRLLADIAPEVSLDDARPDGDIQDELGLDSIDFLNLMVAIDEETGLEIPERDYPQLSTIDGLLGYLAAHVPTPAGG